VDGRVKISWSELRKAKKAVGVRVCTSETERERER